MNDSTNAKGATTITREELYAQVWQTPMSKLATQYGISGNGLAKICDKLKVPYPPRGYWAKKVAGKKVITFQLPPADSNQLQRVTITPTVPAAKPTIPTEVQEKIAAASMDLTVNVSERLSSPHQIIASWIKSHEERKEEARRERDPWRKKHLDPGEFSESDRRRHRILDGLFKSLEKAQAKIGNSQRGAIIVTVDKEDIEIQLREKLKQIKRPLTENEKRYSHNRERGWVQELQPNRILAFSIKTYLGGGLRSDWVENSKSSMESFLPEIFATIVAAGPLLAERRRAKEEAEKRRQIAERIRYEEEQRRKKEDNRWRRFIDFANQWSEIENAQAFLSVLKNAARPEGTIEDKTLDEWLGWAEESLREQDPLRHGLERIFGTIAAVNAWNYRN